MHKSSLVWFILKLLCSDWSIMMILGSDWLIITIWNICPRLIFHQSGASHKNLSKYADIYVNSGCVTAQYSLPTRWVFRDTAQVRIDQSEETIRNIGLDQSEPSLNNQSITDPWADGEYPPPTGEGWSLQPPSLCSLPLWHRSHVLPRNDGVQ